MDCDSVNWRFSMERMSRSLFDRFAAWWEISVWAVRFWRGCLPGKKSSGGVLLLDDAKFGWRNGLGFCFQFCGWARRLRLRVFCKSFQAGTATIGRGKCLGDVCSNVHSWLRFSGVQFSNSAFRSVNLPADIEVTVVHWEFYVSFCDVSLYVHSSRLCLQIWMEVGVTHWCVLRSKRNPFVWEICVCLWFYKVRVQVTCVPSWIGICLVLL